VLVIAGESGSIKIEQIRDAIDRGWGRSRAGDAS
jgi:hypothetical protein